MISKLKGKITRTGVHTLYLDTGFIEFEIHVPLKVMEEIQNSIAKKKIWELYIYHWQGEEERLYGFLSFHHRELFRLIITLKGIGPALGLSILSHLDTKELLEICEKKDIASLTKIPKIGKAIAEEIIFEVNRKRKKFLSIAGEEIPGTRLEEIPREDILLALKNLGYTEKKIHTTIEKILKTKPKKALPQTLAEWVREVLKEI